MGLVAVACAATVAAPGAAHADDKTACIEADTQGQEARLKGRWRDAEVFFRACLRLQCPAAIAQDCTARYDDVRASMPMLLVAAHQPDGTDTVDARLLVDGQLVSSILPATGIEVDPGEHVVTIEHAGWAAPEQRIVVREREKDRKLVFQFALQPAPGSTAPSTPDGAAGTAHEGGVDVLGLTLTASGGLAVAVGATFAVIGLAHRSSLLSNSCAASETCSPSDVGAINRDYWIGGIVGGIGLVALGIGVWELVTHHPRQRVDAGLQGLRVSF